MNYNNNIDRKKHYVQPDCKVVLIDLESCINVHVSGVNLNGFDKDEVPPITVVEDDDDEPNAKQNGMWSDDDAI